MDAPKTAEAVLRHAGTSEIRHFDLLRRADHHVFDLAFSVEQNPDLPAGLVAEFGKLSRELRRYDLVGGHPTSA